MNTYQSVALAVIVGMVVSGCGKGGDDAGDAEDVKISDDAVSFTVNNEDGCKAEFKSEGDEITITDEKGEYSFASDETGLDAKSFPKDILFYPESKLITSISSPESDIFVLNSKDAYKDIAEKYRSDMKEKGWSETTFVSDESAVSIIFEKEERTLNFTVAKEEGSSTISIARTK